MTSFCVLFRQIHYQNCPRYNERYVVAAVDVVDVVVVVVAAVDVVSMNKHHLKHYC